MGGGPCVIIITGEGLRGGAFQLATTVDASCQLVDYLDGDDEIDFDEADTKPIEKFHVKAGRMLKELNAELDKINRDLAAKYNRDVG